MRSTAHTRCSATRRARFSICLSALLLLVLLGLPACGGDSGDGEPADTGVTDVTDVTDDATTDPGVDPSPDLTDVSDVAAEPEPDVAPMEICDNGTDDDGDNDADCADTDCRADDACTVTVVSAGEDHACAVRTSGQVVCWGNGADGRLGNGEDVDTAFGPVQAGSITDGLGVAAGSDFSCAVHSTGTVSCWGANGEGQLGDGSQIASSTPVDVEDIDSATAIAAGDQHACAITGENDNVFCWGANDRGQLGTSTSGDQSSTPVQVDIFVSPAAPPLPIDSVADVACGQEHCCGVLLGGAAVCWGDNQFGQLGANLDTLDMSAVAGSVLDTDSNGLNELDAIASGALHSCALDLGANGSDGHLYCWGDNADRQLDGASSNSLEHGAVEITSVASPLAVAAGGNHSCVVRDNGRAACWGANGQLQLGTSDSSPVATPTEYGEVDDVAAVAAGRGFTCLRDEAGTALCFGTNTAGQLGSDTTADQTVNPQRLIF